MDLISFAIAAVLLLLVLGLFWYRATPDDRMTDEWRRDRERRDGRLK